MHPVMVTHNFLTSAFLPPHYADAPNNVAHADAEAAQAFEDFGAPGKGVVHALRVRVAQAWEAIQGLAASFQDSRATRLLGMIDGKFGVNAQFDNDKNVWLVRGGSVTDDIVLTDKEFNAFRGEVAKRGLALKSVRVNPDNTVVIRHEVGGVLHNTTGPAMVVSNDNGAVKKTYALEGDVMDSAQWMRRVQTAPAAPAMR